MTVPTEHQRLIDALEHGDRYWWVRKELADALAAKLARLEELEQFVRRVSEFAEWSRVGCLRTEARGLLAPERQEKGAA